MNVSRRSFLSRVAAAFAGVAAATKAKAEPIARVSTGATGSKLFALMSKQKKACNGQFNWWDREPPTLHRGYDEPSADLGKEGDTYLEGRTGKVYRRFENWMHIGTALNT